MTQVRRYSSLVLVWTLILFSCQPQESTQISQKEGLQILMDYVHEEDPFFRYEIVHQVEEEGFQYVVAKMYSQKWLSEATLDDTDWWHWVSIVLPHEAANQTGMMWIGGGSKDSELRNEPSELILQAALSTNSIVAEVHNIPFQPVVFANDNFGERYEDAIIAYGWRKFLEGGAKDEDAVWLARLPMTKAVKLAMDVVQEVAVGQGKEVREFVVAGASKRGWTTWTTAAVDERVVALAPIVIDMLNVVPSFQHHWRNYGFWAPAVDDYVREGIMDWQDSKEYARLLEITEPYSFLEKLEAKPKLLINAAGDQFFQPDSWKFYWEDLPGEKHLQYVPNFGHDLSESDAFANLLSFYASVLNGNSRPNYHWEIEGDVIKVQTDPGQKPASIKLWKAVNENTRDFRIDELGPAWTATEVLVNESGSYTFEMEAPSNGNAGYFVEITYPGEAPIKVTTGIDVLPREYPFEPYQAKKPMGSRE